MYLKPFIYMTKVMYMTCLKYISQYIKFAKNCGILYHAKYYLSNSKKLIFKNFEKTQKCKNFEILTKIKIV